MICFVLLHYLALDCTIKCIDCIKTLRGCQDAKIIVVDNASPDGSGAKLVSRFKNDSRVEVLLNEKNTGFANGNNTGIAYAHEKYAPEFIVVLNSDVEILQEDFCEKIHEINEAHPFDLLGPDIVSTYSNVHQSPKTLEESTLERVRAKAAYVRRSQNPILMYLCSGEKSFDWLWRKVQRRRRAKSGINFSKPIEGAVLHGSCVIFSSRYIDRVGKPFYPGTMMYYEMEILDWICRRDGSVVRYDPALHVIHHQNVATGMQYRSIVARSKFVAASLLDSLNAAEELMLSAEAMEEYSAVMPASASDYSYRLTSQIVTAEGRL